MFDIFISYRQNHYNECGLRISRLKDLHYTAFDENTANAVIQCVSHALGEVDCVVINAVKVYKPVEAVLKSWGAEVEDDEQTDKH